jgi:hypothetical protein
MNDIRHSFIRGATRIYQPVIQHALRHQFGMITLRRIPPLLLRGRPGGGLLLPPTRFAKWYIPALTPTLSRGVPQARGCDASPVTTLTITHIL